MLLWIQDLRYQRRGERSIIRRVSRFGLAWPVLDAPPFSRETTFTAVYFAKLWRRPPRARRGLQHGKCRGGLRDDDDGILLRDKRRL